MKKNWEDDAWDDYLYWQSQDKKYLQNIKPPIVGGLYKFNDL